MTGEPWTLGGPAAPVVSNAAPVAPAAPVVGPAEPVVGPAEPVVDTADPVVAVAEPVVDTADPVVAVADPMVAVAESVAVEPVAAEPVAAEPVVAEPVVVSVAGAVVTADRAPPMRTRHRWGWRFLWDAVVVYSVYQLYELVRAKVAGSSSAAFHNAQHIVALERALHLYWEHGVQQHLLAHTRVLQFWDIYYGSIHFGVPVVVLIVLYHRWPQRYRQWRNVLGWTVGIALVSFALYPLMPPRLMPSSYGFVDTAARLGGLGPLDRGSLKDVENLYAAMPSLHIGWSTWSAFALVPVLRRWWAKGLLVTYPFLTLVAVVVTANHWILDAVGGLVALWLGHLASGTWDARRNRSTAQPTSAG